MIKTLKSKQHLPFNQRPLACQLLEFSIFRLANILKLTNIEENKIWTFLKKVKLETSFETECATDGLYRDNDKMSQVLQLEKQIGINSTDVRFDNVTRSNLKTAGEMFIYLNACSKTSKSWPLFYKQLFQTKSPAEIILTLNRIMKAPQKSAENIYFTNMAHLFFRRTTDLLSLNYEEVQDVFFSGTKNISLKVKEDHDNIKTEGTMSLSSMSMYLILIKFAEINHPVHIITQDKQMSPSAFIPFCEFGGNMSAVGAHIDQFNVPVCTSFEAKILNDQLCYEVDLNRFASKANVHNELELGFNFIMDYNEDRQITNNENVIEEKNAGLASNFIESDKKNHAFIYLNTIGKDILTAYI